MSRSVELTRDVATPSAQRQTGRLTAYEVDAVLAQYRLAAEQSALPSVPPSASASSSYTKRKRIDWSKVDLEELANSGLDGAGEADLARASFATTASTSTAAATPHTSLIASPPPRSPASSSTRSFSSHSPSRTSPSMSRDSSASGSTTYPYQYKRGANSLFGARASGEGKRSAGMAKSRSRESTASAQGQGLVSANGPEREREVSASGAVEDAEEGEVDEALLVQSDSPDPAADPTSPIPSLLVKPSTPTSPAFPPPLSPKQLRRISRALDDIEVELSKTYHERSPPAVEMAEDEEEEDARGVEESEGSEYERREDVAETDLQYLDGISPVSALAPPSPTSLITEADLAGLATFNSAHPASQADDTEPVDPFYQRASPAPPSRAPPSPPRPSHETPHNRDSISASLSHASSIDRVAASRTTSPTPTPSLSSITIPDRAALSLDTDDDDDDPSGGLTPSTAADGEDEPEELSPRFGVERFPPVVARTDSDETERAAELTGASGLARGGEEELFLEAPHAGDEADKTVSDSGPFDLSLGEGPVGREACEEEEPDSRAAHRRSTATLDSVGSSFHGSAPSDDDDGDDVFPPHSTSPLAPGSPVSSVPPSSAPALSRPHSLATHTVVPLRAELDKSAEADVSPSHLRPTSYPLDRQPSNDLLQVISVASRRADRAHELGDTSDLILEDLLLIQEKLVQSAARRAARSANSPKSAVATPSTAAASPSQEHVASPPVQHSAQASEPLVASPEHPPTLPRKESGEATDLGGQLAGLGLSSLMPFEFGTSPDSPHRRRHSTGRDDGDGDAGRRQSDAAADADEEAGERDSALLGPTSTQMTVQTSQTSSMSPFTNSAITPSSTEHSDVFEFSSLVGSREFRGFLFARRILTDFL